jgi:hypothetical protein
MRRRPRLRSLARAMGDNAHRDFTVRREVSTLDSSKWLMRYFRGGRPEVNMLQSWLGDTNRELAAHWQLSSRTTSFGSCGVGE